jgi:hypothetical protein
MKRSPSFFISQSDLVAMAGLVVFAGKSRWGLSDFIPLRKLMDPSRGYVVGSSCILKADFNIIGSSNYV